jgi:hypothetical protein
MFAFVIAVAAGTAWWIVWQRFRRTQVPHRGTLNWVLQGNGARRTYLYSLDLGTRVAAWCTSLACGPEPLCATSRIADSCVLVKGDVGPIEHVPRASDSRRS